MAVKYFNVSTIGVVCSLKPIIVCMFAVLVMGESMGALDVTSNILSIVAILLVILGTSGAESSNMDACFWAFIALIMQPVLLSAGDLLLKKMGKLPEKPVSFTQGLALAVFASIYMLIAGESFSFVFDLSKMAWFYLIIMCVLTIAGQFLKKGAVDVYDLSQLQKTNNMSSFW